MADYWTMEQWLYNKHNLYGATPYDVLEVDRESAVDVIREAYRAMAQANHPDRGGETGRMQAINAAWEILQDPQHREVFDKSLDDFNERGVEQFQEDADDLSGDEDVLPGDKPDPNNFRLRSGRIGLTISGVGVGELTVDAIEEQLRAKVDKMKRNGRTLRITELAVGQENHAKPKDPNRPIHFHVVMKASLHECWLYLIEFVFVVQ